MWDGHVRSAKSLRVQLKETCGEGKRRSGERMGPEGREFGSKLRQHKQGRLFRVLLIQSQIFFYYPPNKSNWETSFTPQKFTPKTFMAKLSVRP